MVLPTKSRDLLTTWLHDKEKALFLDFRITYGNQTWQSGNLERLYPLSHEIFWPCGYVTIEKRYIWTFTFSIAPKLGKVVIQVKWTPSTKSCDHEVA